LQEMDLVDAASFGGAQNDLCFGAGASWLSVGNDGCGDNSKAGSGTTTGVYGATFDDNLLNPYWGSVYGPGGYFSREFQLDAPMGALLTEGTGRYFALAYFASRFRNLNYYDTDPGDFDMSAINDGDANPLSQGKNNIIRWQTVPHLSLTSISPDPPDPNAIVAITVS